MSLWSLRYSCPHNFYSILGSSFSSLFHSFFPVDYFFLYIYSRNLSVNIVILCFFSLIFSICYLLYCYLLSVVLLFILLFSVNFVILHFWILIYFDILLLFFYSFFLCCFVLALYFRFFTLSLLALLLFIAMPTSAVVRLVYS